MKHPMRPACVEYTPGSQENQIPPYIGQGDLIGALEAELGYIDLIRNFLLIWWNLEIQPTSNYSLGMALHDCIGIRSC